MNGISGQSEHMRQQQQQSGASLQDSIQMLLQVTYPHQQQQITVSQMNDFLNHGYKREPSVDLSPSRLCTKMSSGEGSPKEEAGGMPTRPSSPFLLYSTPTGVQIQSQHSAEAGNARRNKTFSPEMSDLFVQEVIKRRNTLVENNTNREVDFNKLKKQAWAEVFEAVHSVFPSFQCTVEGMKTHWRYRKRRVRDAIPSMRSRGRQQRLEVEDNHAGERMNEADWAIYDILAQTNAAGPSPSAKFAQSVGTNKSHHDDTEGFSDLEAENPPAKMAKMEEVVSNVSKSNMMINMRNPIRTPVSAGLLTMPQLTTVTSASLAAGLANYVSSTAASELLPSPNADGIASSLYRHRYSCFTPTQEDELSRSTTISDVIREEISDRRPSVSGGTSSSCSTASNSLLQSSTFLSALQNLHQQQLQQQPSPTIHPPLVSPIVVPALRMPNGGYEDNESEEHLKKTLLKEQTKFYATLNCFVQECRAAMPLIVNQFVAVTSPHQQPAAANAFTQLANACATHLPGNTSQLLLAAFPEAAAIVAAASQQQQQSSS